MFSHQMDTGSSAEILTFYIHIMFKWSTVYNKYLVHSQETFVFNYLKKRL